jgi:hypothetical protein
MDLPRPAIQNVTRGMQNPGSDAGVFVWARGRHGAANIDARRNVTSKNPQRHAEKTLHARWDIPAMHTLRKYTMVCVDNFKKIFCARVAKRTDSPTSRGAE